MEISFHVFPEREYKEAEGYLPQWSINASCTCKLHSSLIGIVLLQELLLRPLEVMLV